MAKISGEQQACHRCRGGILQREFEPLPFLGDTMFLHILNEMGRANPAVYERSDLDPDRPFSDRLTITQTGQEVLRAVTDWLSLHRPVRWLGGVRIDPSTPNWRQHCKEHGGSVTMAAPGKRLRGDGCPVQAV